MVDLFPDLRFEVLSVHDLEHVTLAAVSTLNALPHERPTRHFALAWADGKIISSLISRSESEALGAVGLSE